MLGGIYGKRLRDYHHLGYQKIGKKAQEKDDEITKKLYEANRHWNDWILQLDWNKLEWINPRRKIKIKAHSVSSKTFFIDKDLRTVRWVGHSLLK